MIPVSAPWHISPPGPAFRSRAAGALETTGHNRPHYQNQAHQKGEHNEKQVAQK